MICPPTHKHGENGTCYSGHGCRCDDCKQGRAEYQFWWEHMRAAGRAFVVDATGTRRRLQALAALGWSARAIGDRFGRGDGIVHRWMTRSATVTRATAVMVDAWFTELAMTKPALDTVHDRYSVGRARAHAARRGWVPPLAWDDIDNDPAPARTDDEETVDEIAVELAITGVAVRLTPAERRECVRRLHRERWSDGRIAETIRCADKTVERIRAELGLVAFDQTELRQRGAA